MRRQTDARLEAAILANLPEGIALVRARDGVLVYVNDTWDRMFGYEPGELVGRHVSVVNAPGEMSPLDRADEIIGSLERHGEWHGELECLRKDGTRLWCAVNLSAFEHPEHGPVWLAVESDVTERKRAELAVHEAEELFRTVFEAGPMGIVILDQAGRLVEANEAFAALVGYAREEVLGRRLDDLTHPDDRALSADLAPRVLSGELRRYRVVQRYLTKGGEAVPVAVTATTVRDASGRPLYGLAIVEDGAARRAAVLSSSP